MVHDGSTMKNKLKNHHESSTGCQSSRTKVIQTCGWKCLTMVCEMILQKKTIFDLWAVKYGAQPCFMRVNGGWYCLMMVNLGQQWLCNCEGLGRSSSKHLSEARFWSKLSPRSLQNVGVVGEGLVELCRVIWSNCLFIHQAPLLRCNRSSVFPSTVDHSFSTWSTNWPS